MLILLLIAFDFNNGEQISKVGFEGRQCAIQNVAVKWPFTAVVTSKPSSGFGWNWHEGGDIKIFNMATQSFIRHIENGGYSCSMQDNVFTSFHPRNGGL